MIDWYICCIITLRTSFWWYLKDTDVGWKKKPKLSRRKLHWHMTYKTATLIWIPTEWKEKGSQIIAYRCLCLPSQSTVWYVYSSSAALVCLEGRGLRFISVLLISRKWWWPGKNLPHTESTHSCCTAAVHLALKHFCAASVGQWIAVLFKGQTQTRDTGTDHSSSHFSAKVASKSYTVLGIWLYPFKQDRMNTLILPSDLFSFQIFRVLATDVESGHKLVISVNKWSSVSVPFHFKMCGLRNGLTEFIQFDTNIHRCLWMK